MFYLHMRINVSFVSRILSCLVTAALVLPSAYSETINGNLVIAGDTVVQGDLRVEGNTANRKSFYIGGDAETYYPVFFSDHSWHYGQMDLQVYRASVHTDSDWQGSLMARFTSHSSGWGNGSEFVEASIRYNKTPHLADYINAYYGRGIVLWLKGQATYYYHAVGKTPTVDFNDSGDGYLLVREHNGQVIESYVSRADVNPEILLEGRMYSDSASFQGRVGIGVGNPQNKLDVNGTIRAKEVIVESGWADFVFEPGYRLRDLSEVEIHIQAHGRLPDVPSAEEIQDKGLSLGESQTLLMQKIEELTLYAIEKDRRVDELESKNESLEARLEKTEAALEKLLRE